MIVPTQLLLPSLPSANVAKTGRLAGGSGSDTGVHRCAGGDNDGGLPKPSVMKYAALATSADTSGEPNGGSTRAASNGDTGIVGGDDDGLCGDGKGPRTCPFPPQCATPTRAKKLPASALVSSEKTVCVCLQEVLALPPAASMLNRCSTARKTALTPVLYG